MNITKHEPASQLFSGTAGPSPGHPAPRAMGAVPRRAPRCPADAGDAPGQHVNLASNARGLAAKCERDFFLVWFFFFFD